MPIFQTFADYDKWHRRQLLKRLRRLQGPEAANSVAQAAEAAGDASIKGSSTSLQTGASPGNAIQSDGASPALARAAAGPRGTISGDGPSAALTRGMEHDHLPSENDAQTAEGQELQKKQRIVHHGPSMREGSSRSPSFKSTELQFVEDSGDFWMEATDNTLGVNGVDQENYTQSLWFKIADPGGPINITLSDNLPATRRQQVVLVGSTGEDVQVQVITFSGTVSSTTTVGVINFDEPNHVFISGSSTDASDAFVLWLNGVEIVNTTWGFAAGVTSFEYWWGTDDGSTYAGLAGTQFADYYIAQEFVPDPTGLFITPNGKPRSGGQTGNQYTGTAPYVWISGDASVWNAGTNAGTGGDFTATGTVVDPV